MPVVRHQLDQGRRTNSVRPSSREGPPLRMVAKKGLNSEHYATEITSAVARVARTFRLSAAETEDLRSDVWIKLLEQQARVLRAFGGRARIGTYLVTIARNVLFDRRNKEWGKWRPSTAARRAGPFAIALDRMLTRDGLSLDVAEQSLRCAGVLPSDAVMTSVASLLPARRKRRFVDMEVLESFVSSVQGPHEMCCSNERTEAEHRLRVALANALGTLSGSDRQLLVWRFVDGMTIAAIAPLARLEARAMYRHFDRLMRRLRCHLETAGVHSTTVRSVLTETTHSFECDLCIPASSVPLLIRKLA